MLFTLLQWPGFLETIVCQEHFLLKKVKTFKICKLWFSFLIYWKKTSRNSSICLFLNVPLYPHINTDFLFSTCNSNNENIRCTFQFESVLDLGQWLSSFMHASVVTFGFFLWQPINKLSQIFPLYYIYIHWFICSNSFTGA